MSTALDTDRIERSVVINAPRERVWRALSNAEEFGTWFGANLKGQTFAPGQRARGPITYPGYEHGYFDVVIEYAKQGAHVVLVGETLVRGENPREAVADLVAAGSSLQYRIRLGRYSTVHVGPSKYGRQPAIHAVGCSSRDCEARIRAQGSRCRLRPWRWKCCL